MLSTNKIKDLLLHGENRQVEFKKCTDKVSASVYETVCSFLNAEGGYIFLGVDDDGTILGINPKCVTDMTKSIINTLNNPEQFLPPMPITPEQTEIDGKIILYLNVPESEQVHRYKNRFYDRWGDADNDVSKHTYLVKNMFMRKEKESAEYTYRRSKDRVRDRVDKTKRDARSSARQTFGAFMDPKVQEHFMTAGFEFIMGVNNLIRALPHTPFEENDHRDDYYYDDDEEEEEIYQKPKKRSSPRSIEIIASEDEEDKSEGRSRKRSPAREE